MNQAVDHRLGPVLLVLRMAFANEVGQRAFAHRAATEVAQQFAGTLVRQELIVLEVHGRGLDAGAVLHRGVDPFGERRLVQVAAGAALDLGLMLGDDQPNVGQIMDLSFLDALGWSKEFLSNDIIS